MGLEWNDIDFRAKFCFTVTDPKGNSVTLPLNEAAIHVLNEALKIKPFPDCPYVFPNRFGERRVSFTHIWYRIRKAAGLPGNFQVPRV